MYVCVCVCMYVYTCIVHCILYITRCMLHNDYMYVYIYTHIYIYMLERYEGRCFQLVPPKGNAHAHSPKFNS